MTKETILNQWLNYHHLYYFKTIAEEGSIAKASEKLLIGQPALSMQLKQLEENLEIKLFDRQNKKLILTQSGKTVLEYAKTIFRLGQELKDHIGDTAIPNRLRIQIGVHYSLPKNTIAKITNFIFAQKNPYIIIESGNTEKLMSDLMYHQLDFIILPHPPLIKDKGLINSKMILSSPIIFCGHKKFLKLKKNFPQGLDLAPIILPPENNKLRHEVENFYQNNKLKLNIVAECEDTYIQKQMAIHGDGIIPIMADAVKPYIKSHSLEVIGEMRHTKEEIWIACMKRKVQNPITQLVFESLDVSKH